MAEEQKWQEATNHVLCANNCGFFGNPTTLNLCSKCHKSETSFLSHDVAGPVPVLHDQSVSEPTDSELALPSAAAVSNKPQQRNRCGSCRKRVGLTGFTCRCGTTFCGTHRYPEEHECSFDFKTVGKEAIARENPVVKGVKLPKI